MLNNFILFLIPNILLWKRRIILFPYRNNFRGSIYLTGRKIRENRLKISIGIYFREWIARYSSAFNQKSWFRVEWFWQISLNVNKYTKRSNQKIIFKKMIDWHRVTTTPGRLLLEKGKLTKTPGIFWKHFSRLIFKNSTYTIPCFPCLKINMQCYESIPSFRNSHNSNRVKSRRIC